MQILEHGTLRAQQIVRASDQLNERCQQIFEARIEQITVAIIVQLGEQNARSNDEFNDVL